MHSLCKVASIDSKWRVLAQSGEYWVLLANLARTKILSIFQQCIILSKYLAIRVIYISKI